MILLGLGTRKFSIEVRIDSFALKKSEEEGGKTKSNGLLLDASRASHALLHRLWPFANLVWQMNRMNISSSLFVQVVSPFLLPPILSKAYFVVWDNDFSSAVFHRLSPSMIDNRRLIRDHRSPGERNLDRSDDRNALHRPRSRRAMHWTGVRVSNARRNCRRFHF